MKSPHTQQQPERKVFNIKVENFPQKARIIEKEEIKNFLISFQADDPEAAEEQELTENDDDIQEVIIEEYQDTENTKHEESEEAEEKVMIFEEKLDENSQDMIELEQNTLTNIETLNNSSNKRKEQPQQVLNPFSSNQYFLLSLTEIFDRLPRDKNTRARIKVMELLYNIENGLE